MEKFEYFFLSQTIRTLLQRLFSILSLLLHQLRNTMTTGSWPVWIITACVDAAIYMNVAVGW